MDAKLNGFTAVSVELSPCTMGTQPDYYKWPFQSSYRCLYGYVWVHIYTYHPQGTISADITPVTAELGGLSFR